jgi:hypothetical protein
MQKFDRLSNRWITVPYTEWSDEAIRAYDLMEAHIDVAATEEAMKLGLNIHKDIN